VVTTSRRLLLELSLPLHNLAKPTDALASKQTYPQARGAERLRASVSLDSDASIGRTTPTLLFLFCSASYGGLSRNKSARSSPFAH
jgi:hypothetical protein